MNGNAELVFFAKWLRSPLRVASVAPSGPHLSRAMATSLPPGDGLVVELGGGTGPITRALLDAGVDPERLLVIERDPQFFAHLRGRFPKVQLLCGDALHLHKLVRDAADATEIRAVVSGLPLLSMTSHTQHTLLGGAMALSGGKAPFVQFSYGLGSPLKAGVASSLGLTTTCVGKVWRNLPPAKVWHFTQESSDSSFDRHATTHAA